MRHYMLHHGFQTRTGLYGPTGKISNRSFLRFFKLQKPFNGKKIGTRVNCGQTSRFWELWSDCFSRFSTSSLWSEPLKKKKKTHTHTHRKTDPHRPNHTELWADWTSRCQRPELDDLSDAGAVTQSELIFKTDPYIEIKLREKREKHS